MVNKYTTGIPIIKPIDSVDVDFAHQVLVKKQEQFDTGYANLQKMFQAVDGLGLTKENEKAYLQGKIKETTEKINKLGNIDYSDNKLVGALGIDIANIAKDPIVQNAVLNKQAYEQLMDRYTKLKENPKLYEQYYSPYNEAEDMEKVKAYLNDADLTHKFRTNTPTFKVDIDKKIDEELEKKMKIKTQRSDGVYIYTREGLTAEQLRAKVQSDIMSNPSYSNQLKINAKWKYNDDKVFNQMLSPLVKSYDSQIDALEQEIQRKAAAIPNASGVGKEQQLQVLNYEKSNLENQKKQFEAISNELKDPMIDLSRKKEIFEMMQLQERAVNSFPQSEIRTPDKFALLAQQGLQKEKQMGLKFNYDVAIKEQEAKIDIAKQQQLEALGLNKSSSSKTTAETGINPIGEAMPTTAISNDNREGIINNQISNYKEQNAADFIGLMSQMISEKMDVDNPDVLKNAMTTAFLANRKAGNEKLGEEFFNKYVKNTPSYQKLEKKMQDGLIAQYNHLNSAYKDVLDGKQDVDFSSWEFSNETQEALTKIQLRSYNMKVKEDMLNKAK